jgi:Rrf2 family protein
VVLSAKTEYAVLALLELARHFNTGETVQIRHIAEQQQIPDRYLEQLLATLRQQGLVKSQRGAKGGYLLGRPPGHITLLDIVVAIEGQTNSAHLDRQSIDSAVVAEIWQQAQQSAQQVFQNWTLQALLDRCDACSQTSAIYYI